MHIWYINFKHFNKIKGKEKSYDEITFKLFLVLWMKKKKLFGAAPWNTLNNVGTSLDERMKKIMCNFIVVKHDFNV